MTRTNRNHEFSQRDRELIEERIKERDIGAYVDNLWNRIGKKLKAEGATHTTIEKAIKTSRKERG